jgi:phosphoketolase
LIAVFWPLRQGKKEKEEGIVTTYFDMTALNDLDRFHLAQDVINRVPKPRSKGAPLKRMAQEKPRKHNIKSMLSHTV